jgi:hypothetical protein
VHAGPPVTLGHHVPPTPQLCGAITLEPDAKVNAADALHAALVAPWQVSVPASHRLPSTHTVAERGPAKDAGATPARAASHAPHEGAAVMLSAAALPR